MEVQGDLKRKLITQLQPDTEYSFVLMSRGNSAGGLQQQVSIRTAPDLLKMKPVRYQHDVEEGGKVTISLPRVPAGAPVRSVLPVVKVWRDILCVTCFLSYIQYIISSYYLSK